MRRSVLAAVGAVGLLVVSNAEPADAGGDGVLLIGSATVAVGEAVSLPVEVRDVPKPGLGDWVVTVQYDPIVLAATGCVVNFIGACNTASEVDAQALTGVVEEHRLTGDHTLGAFSFRCVEAGTSQLALTLDVSAIAVVPPPIVTNLEIQNGTITCVAPTATATAMPPATATPVSAALPSAGGGGNAQGKALWLVVALAALGAAVLMLGGRLWRRRER